MRKYLRLSDKELSAIIDVAENFIKEKESENDGIYRSYGPAFLWYGGKEKGYELFAIYQYGYEIDNAGWLSDEIAPFKIYYNDRYDDNPNYSYEKDRVQRLRWGVNPLKRARQFLEPLENGKIPIRDWPLKYNFEFGDWEAIKDEKEVFNNGS